MNHKKILTDESLMELQQYESNHFPFRQSDKNMQDYHNNAMDWHWHKEFEFITVYKGTILCKIGDTTITLQEGHGIFINSGVIHRIESPHATMISNVLFTSDFIASPKRKIYETLITPLLTSGRSHITLNPETTWQNEILSNLHKIRKLYNISSITKELDIHAYICHIWSILFTHQKDFITLNHTGLSLLTQARLRRMILYIEQNYADKITLHDIASSANVSKSEALRCFKTGMHTPPIDYLNKHRLQQAKELLGTTANTVTDISHAVGFNNTSYFVRMYKREYGVTPKSDQRKKQIK